MLPRGIVVPVEYKCKYKYVFVMKCKHWSGWDSLEMKRCRFNSFEYPPLGHVGYRGCGEKI